MKDRIALWLCEYKKIVIGKGNMMGRISKLIFSFLFALMMMLSRMIVFNGSVFGSVDENYFLPFSWSYLVLFVVAFCLSFLLLCALEWGMCKLESRRTCQTIQQKKWYFFWLFTAVLLICWMPYYLSYFPGGVYSDTFLSIGQAMGNLPISNHHPVLYMLILKVFIGIGSALGQGLQFSIGLFTLAQCVVMAMVLAYFLYWMYKHGVGRAYIICVTVFFSLFSLVPYYAIAVWKDTPFSLAMFMYILQVLDVAISNGESLLSWKGTIKYAVCALLVAFLRNNGGYIVLATTFVIVIVYRKKVLGPMKKYLVISLASIVLIFGVQGPVFDRLGYNEDKAVESYGCLIQQIAYVISTDGQVSQDQLAFLENIIPVERMKDVYAPCIVDNIKWDVSFNTEYLNTHKSEFLKVWASIAKNNPGKVIQAHLLETLGFWDATRGTSTAYIQKDVWFDGQGLVSVDYFEKIFGFSFDRIVAPTHYISAALFAWIALMNLTIVISQKKYRFALVYLVPILLWATILVAAPLAFSLRYIYIFVLFVPIAFLLPVFPYRNENEKLLP